MQTSSNGVALIKQFEGLRLQAYLDSVGIPTIGYGHTKGVQMGQTITSDQAEEFLKQDLRVPEKVIDAIVKVPLTQNQFDALVCFAFNVGTGALSKSTLLKKLNAGDYTGAANEFLRWNKAGGKPLAGLTRRREAERILFNKQENV